MPHFLPFKYITVTFQHLLLYCGFLLDELGRLKHHLCSNPVLIFARLSCVVQIRVSAVLTNGAYLLNVDCDHYFNNSKAIKEAMCFMMDPAYGKKTCYVQFPQRFDGIDLHDRYANRNIVFFDVRTF